MTDKTFTVAGTSNLNGQVKIRFANDTSRGKVLQKSGHTEIVLIELPEAMTKDQAAFYLIDKPEFQSASQQMAIGEYVSRPVQTKAVVKVEKTVKVKASKPRAPKTHAPKTRVERAVEEAIDLSELEDAPF